MGTPSQEILEFFCHETSINYYIISRLIRLLSTSNFAVKNSSPRKLYTSFSIMLVT